MNEKKHTSAPWNVVSGLRAILPDGTMREVPVFHIEQAGRVAGENCVAGIVPREEDARLIAAAPDLLAVARRAVAACTCHATMRPDIPCLSCAARAAIEKANASAQVSSEMIVRCRKWKRCKDKECGRRHRHHKGAWDSCDTPMPKCGQTCKPIPRKQSNAPRQF